jgi:hypothetical protein
MVVFVAMVRMRVLPLAMRVLVIVPGVYMRTAV